jgi:rubredoxin
MIDNPKQLRLHCKACDLTFDTGFTFPMQIDELSEAVDKTKCPTCGAGAEELLIRGNKK